MLEQLQTWSHVTFVDRVFIFGFVPLALLAFGLAIRGRRNEWPALVLIIASLTFYASWGVNFLLILSMSMLLNYCARQFMLRRMVSLKTR